MIFHAPPHTSENLHACVSRLEPAHTCRESSATLESENERNEVVAQRLLPMALADDPWLKVFDFPDFRCPVQRIVPLFLARA